MVGDKKEDMANKRKADKKTNRLEASFETVLVCKKNSFRSHLEVFVAKPENIAQKDSGVIAGILEIDDESEDSSYIVNYLVSVLKKEYYSRTKRGSFESFEAALHKVNLALAKLAEHGNVGWIGKINAIIFTIEKNNLYLSQTGQTHAFLLRQEILTDIAENSQSPSEPNPLKTFVDVISGRLEKDDKLVVSTRHIFDIFSPEEIKRSALKFSSSDFVRFLKTALGNELERSAVLFVEMKEEELPEKTVVPEKSQELNAFSQTAFYKSKKPAKDNTDSPIDAKERKDIISEIKEELTQKNGSFVDQKTGHIYIKEDSSLKEEPSAWENIWENLREKTSEFSLRTKDIVSNVRKNKNEAQNNQLPRTESKGSEKDTGTQKGIDWKKIGNGLMILWKNKLLPTVQNVLRTIGLLLSKGSKFIASKISYAWSLRRQKIVPEVRTGYISHRNWSIWPNFSRIKDIFSRLDKSHKIYAAVAVILLLIVPYFISKINNGKNPAPPAPATAPADVLPPLSSDKNVVKIENLDQLFSQNGILGIADVNGTVLAVSDTALFEIRGRVSYDFPEGFSSPAMAFSMNDLNLIFLMNKENRIISWSPASKKFQDNALNLPENPQISAAKSSSTYSYFLDKNANQIYRYPRATGGFGDKVDWLKENINLGSIVDLAVSDNIYLAGKNDVFKLYRGKKEDFNLEKTDTPLSIDKLYTLIDSPHIYILDKSNSRVVKFDLDGNIVAQYYNDRIKNANDFTVDEENSTVYISTTAEVRSFEMK